MMNETVPTTAVAFLTQVLTVLFLELMYSALSWSAARRLSLAALDGPSGSKASVLAGDSERSISFSTKRRRRTADGVEAAPHAAGTLDRSQVIVLGGASLLTPPLI